MNKIQQYAIYGLIILVGIFVCFGASAKIWEVVQPKQYVLGAKVHSIEPYIYTNDIHWSLRGYRIYIVGENKAIDFSLKNWDSTVQKGDVVDTLVRRSFPWFGFKDELDGLSIDDHK